MIAGGIIARLAALLAHLGALVGWPGIIVLCLLAFYEGVPGVNAIPMIGHVPVVGDLAVGRVGRVRLEAEENGAEIERAIWVALQDKLQAEHNARAAAIQYRINAISRASANARAEHQMRLAILNQQLMRVNDEDYLCSAGGPVFSDGLRQRLNAIGGN